jgi:hypothetical protein
MSLGTPRRMKMTFIAAPPQSRSRDSLQRAGSEIVCYLVLRACRGVGPRYPHQGFSTEYPPVICTHDEEANPGTHPCTETQFTNQRPDWGRPGSFWMVYGREHLAVALRLPTVGYREHR